MLQQHNIFFPLSCSVTSPQFGCVSPARPSLTLSRRSSAKKPTSGHFSKADGGKCVSLKSGKDKLSVDAKITNSAPSSTSRQSPPGRSPPKNKKGKKCALSGVSAERGYRFLKDASPVSLHPPEDVPAVRGCQAEAQPPPAGASLL